MSARRGLFAALVLAALAACDGGPASTGAAAGDTTTASAPSAAPTAKPLDAVARIPVEAAAAARAALEQAVSVKDPRSPGYLEFRRAVARGEPFFRKLGFQAEALFGGGPADEAGGALGRLDAAMEARDQKAIETHAGEASRALLLLEDALTRSPVKRKDLTDIVPRAAYWMGAAIAGSKPGLSREPAAAIADALGLLDTIRDGIVAAYVEKPSAMIDQADAIKGRLDELGQEIRSALEPALATGELRRRASLVVSTGWLGTVVRLWLSGLGGTAWKPYSPRAPKVVGADDGPISVLTVPELSRPEKRTEAEKERLAALGEKLFSDKTLSKGGARSCATCHVPNKAYSDGKARPESLLPDVPLLRNTPTLLYASLQAAQFWDGRALTSERQALLVMHSKAEMDVPDSAFPRPGVASAGEAAAALALFQARRLVPASAPIDELASGTDGALSDEEAEGFDVFAGKGRCARCHVPPLFGGTHPPDFSTVVYSVIGVPEKADGKSLDPDRGRAAVTRREADTGAFKTPTLRNVGRTAPYFHNGAFPTLEAVVDFYDKGGGKGLGLPVPNQDPDVVHLHLTEGEKRALVTFLRTALSDAAPSR